MVQQQHFNETTMLSEKEMKEHMIELMEKGKRREKRENFYKSTRSH
jgi:hypothetical protein